MRTLTIKQGNTAVLEALVKDADGEIVTTLLSATEILFKAVEKNSRVIKISKSLTDGIEVNTPSIGYIRITLKPSDTDLPVAEYLIGCQIKWDDDTIYEIDLAINGTRTLFLRIDGDII